MTTHRVVLSNDWIDARKELLKKEKEFTRSRDELSKQRRDLPWERIDKEYVFDGSNGKEPLSDLFDGRKQLIVYHFMFGPDWPEGCHICSMLADHYEPAILHLNQRDVTMVTVSQAPFDSLHAFRMRMGWSFKWVSSLNCDFNLDFHVSFTPEEQESRQEYYNYRVGAWPAPEEAPGMSVFQKDNDGTIYHTYSTYARGLDLFLNVYNLLDIVPKGRDEADLKHSFEWVRHHDRYAG